MQPFILNLRLKDMFRVKGLTPRGGGSTDALSLGTDYETTAPPPLLAISKFTAPLFMEAQGQPLQIVTFR